VIFGSVCSGIEAASAAWHPLGWQAAFFSEIEKFPSRVLAHHYPTVPNLGDMTKFKDWPDASLDVLVGGTPCQSFSVAGLRKGMADPRGNLALVYLALADRYRPRWLVWENVPGVLSSNGGRDFGAFLGALVELGYGFAYRVLDAQFFGVAQRRRRVFVVGHFGDWRRAAAVLFERQSLSGDPAPRRKTGQDVAGTVAASLATGSAPEGERGGLIAFGGNNTAGPIDVATACNASASGRLDFESETFVTHSLRGEGFDASEDGTGRGTPLVPVAFSIMPMNSGKDYKARETDIAQPIMAGGPVGGNQGGDFIACPIAFGWQNSSQQGASASASEHFTPTLDKSKTPAVAIDCYNGAIDGDTTLTLRKGNGNENGGVPAMMQGMAVRRLTPRECERLQGFPDDYTLLPGKTADGPRYKALGNSMAVPVMRWIGERIAQVDAIAQISEAAA